MPLRPEPRLPIHRLPRWRAQIGFCGWNRLKPRPECQWQAEQRAMDVECGQRTALGYDLRRAGKIAHERVQRLLDLKNHLRAARGDQRHIAAELNRIAQSLFAMEQDCLAGDRLPAKPERLR